MRLKHTQARKARTLNPRFYQNHGYYARSVFWRRVNNVYGADYREHDKRHPSLETAVEGYRSRLAHQRAYLRSKGEDQL